MWQQITKTIIYQPRRVDSVSYEVSNTFNSITDYAQILNLNDPRRKIFLRKVGLSLYWECSAEHLSSTYMADMGQYGQQPIQDVLDTDLADTICIRYDTDVHCIKVKCAIIFPDVLIQQDDHIHTYRLISVSIVYR